MDPAYRRKGLAKKMLQVHQQWMPHLLPQVKSRTLICKQDLIGLFQSAGFELLGPSEIVHGKREWYEVKQL